MDEVNERSTSWVTVTLKDKAGALATPSGLAYRIDDVASGTQITDDTALTPDDTVEVEITSTENRILNAELESEEREVTVVADYGAEDKLVEKYRYRVLNLGFHPSPA